MQALATKQEVKKQQARGHGWNGENAQLDKSTEGAESDTITAARPANATHNLALRWLPRFCHLLARPEKGKARELTKAWRSECVNNLHKNSWVGGW